MNAWWNDLTPYQHVLFVIAVATTLFMIFQVVMMFIAGGDDPSFDGSDTAADFDTPGDDPINNDGIGFSFFGLRILTVRSVIAFFAIGSWVAFTFVAIMPVLGATLLGIALGLVAAVLVAVAFKAIEKLQNSGNIDIKNAVGKTGEVYLTVPAKRASAGKVNVFVQERLTEFEAVTDDEEPIKTGSKVKIAAVLGEGTLVIERL